MALVTKKKPFDYNDHHYRDAIGRLKMMLNDVYVPTKYSSNSSIFKSVTDDETDTTENTIIERPAMKEMSKYYSYKPYTSYTAASSSHYKPTISNHPSRLKQRAACNKIWRISNLLSVGGGGSGYASEALLSVGNTQPPSELLNFIEKQESYIEQLERESNFCRVSFKSSRHGCQWC